MFFKKITYANRKIISKVNEILKPFNINATDWRVFYYLSSTKSASLSEICEFYQMDKAIASRICKKLEKANYLEISSSNDKREKIISLSLKGKELFFDANILISNYEKQICDDLDYAEFGLFINMLDKINKKL
ncbi:MULTISPECIES: MarR family transcriptional regulator [unclassified Campylobacter]|uniref:MarR family winged helix-turn-helix transcriptional regulator n=1 Tax=unclassified Campylobacter TaxID=2593542 RepID=UPI001BDADC20|nr:MULTISPECIES: MarR family transcriptional regulator [unclassified Campylobacter]MBZ7976744.1 MarR family transcriptional regulator [Campylobacter sp. RM12637]MBZ7980466.1 MarR family transcriptional regulator [Campylobacter sp. RM12642]MBZ7982258.1 MarR family transcriptional regulator [Campylobacter sp. RM12640]MBZ7989476.1 MarR family transcriptional regulator [Campylobacter sp. RM12635]MBZ7993448.1 MarR family transcriptional regulator [Campylobacter sp. RM9333]MBZ8007971.1 MarR family 